MVRFKKVLAVGFGGAVGALLRYSVITSTAASFFPFGTLIINIVGCFLLGMINGYFASKTKSFVFLALGSGFCGGFTTMSTFSQELVTLMRVSMIQVGIYLGATLVLGLLAGFLGLHIFDDRRGGAV
ncbi:fluoride efflux transporter FluC [Peribacillus sp. NPDC097675]|uniref:fluoride efflux transporter FluC n=1 Tax=Peribacillus sp. NPDC097675 TaxID=3390618 RepID=UPI003D01A8A9